MGWDTVIVGGGVMGCGVALRLCQAGQRVRVVEKAVPGAEASSAAGGILGPQSECDGPGPMLELCLRSRALYPAFAEELREATAIDIEHQRCGALHVAFDAAGLARLEKVLHWQTQLGLAAERVEGGALSALEPALAPRALGGLHFPDEAQVDPRPLARALALAAQRAGAQLQPGTVEQILLQGGAARGVQLSDGTRLEADAVVLAAGAWSGRVPGAGEAAQSVVPARGQMVQLQVAPGTVRRVLFSGGGYLIPRRDGRLLAGSTLEFVGFEKQVTAAGLRSILGLAVDAVPALAQAPVTATWAGFRPYTDAGLPLLGEGQTKGLFYATGHHRNGILLAPITAALVASAVLGQTPLLDLGPFRPARSHG